MTSLRAYQAAAISSVFDYWSEGGENPLVDMATGTGKSVVIAELIRRIATQYPGIRILMLVHVRELVRQNFDTMLRVYPGASIGIYSAGLGKRDGHHRITFASVQSVYQKARQLGRRDLVIIDETHLVPSSGAGMYRRLLDDLREMCPDLRVVGFTATPYRLDSGRLDEGDDRLFNDTVFTYGIGEGIAEGFLSPLISKATAAEIDVSRVERRGGEFVPGSLEGAADKITAQAVEEIVTFGADRRAWLCFCSGVANAGRVRDAMRRAGVSAEMVSGETPGGERDRIIRDYRNGKIRCLTNANVLTTGFDVPMVDLVAMLRPTLSTSLYVQMCGRGTRPVYAAGADLSTVEARLDAIASGPKPNCLVLDFAGNVRRHGPVDSVSVGGKKRGSSGEDDDNPNGRALPDTVRAKLCPDCKSYNALNARACTVCGHLWPLLEKPKHEPRADDTSGILTTEWVPPRMLPVVSWDFRVWAKAGSPDTLRVDYFAGLQTISEWMPFGHTGYARQRACDFWSRHGGSLPFPTSAAEALNRSDELAMPATISVRPDGKFFKITGRTFAMAEAAE